MNEENISIIQEETIIDNYRKITNMYQNMIYCHFINNLKKYLNKIFSGFLS
jgi:hypothetical protein